jgi:methyltransferase-like protein/cyclopropane fatty-acyl-phospholipid synthase-like methyltransferase
MATAQLDPYDHFTYDNYSNTQTHVDRLACLATLFGLEPVPVENCRVLELACGDGSNLLPMALDLTESRFLGIDRAGKPISRGTEIINTLQLKNIELRQIDLMKVGENLGKFDYIIAHGLYSWVPADVRDRIMEICRSSLSTQGIAYISYNVYPGCRLRQAIREMMLFHTRGASDPVERVAQGRGLVKWLADAQTKSTGYATFLRETAESQSKTRDGAIYHDALAEVNDPVYFHQFMAHAAQYGLQFLTEAEHFNVREYDFATEVVTQLQTLAEESSLTQEQYLDFLEGRSFRQTLLCHQALEIDRSLGAERIKQFYLSSPARPASAVQDIGSSERVEFVAHRDASITTNFPLAKAAFLHLEEIYPRAIRLDELLVLAFRRLNTGAPQSDQADQERQLGDLLLKAYGVGVVDFHLHVPRFTLLPGERPLASPLARLQAERRTITTSLLGHNVKIEDSLGIQFLLLLDGTRDRAALLRDFGEVISSSVQLSAPDGTAVDKTKLLQELPQRLEERLLDLGRRGFLLR